MKYTPATVARIARIRARLKVTVTKYGVYVNKAARFVFSGPVAFEEVDGEWFISSDPEGFRYGSLDGYISSRALAAMMREKMGIEGQERVSMDLEKVTANRYRIKPPKQ